MSGPCPLEAEATAYQEFLGSCRRFWSQALLPQLVREADAIGSVPGPGAAEALEKRLQGSATYGFFCWFERHLQRMKYSGRLGLVATLSRRRAELEATLSASPPDGMLKLDDGLAPPSYYTAYDIHQHPGGLWDDPIAGFVYRSAAGQPGAVVARRNLHDRFTALVMERSSPRRIVDLGCGYGKSTLPFAQADGVGEVIGIDLSAPCLRLAALEAAHGQLRNVSFRQAESRATGLPSGSCDVVTSTMMLHEMPPTVIEATLREAYRLLAPGGLSIHLDFLPPEDPLSRLLHFGHARRNNEPFMEPLARMDLDAAHRTAGFAGFEILPFEDEDGALARPRGKKWRLPWAVIVAHKRD
jgi:SAM-dependent methyltransferase